MAESINWNKEPYYPDACPEIKAIEFDLQYEQTLRLSPNHNCTNPPHFPPHCGCPAG